MPDVTEGLRQPFSSGQRPIVLGVVSRSRPAPGAFTDDLFVVLPDVGEDYAYGPCKWGAIHGTTLPAQGASAVLAFDQNDVPYVVWWDGVTVF